MHIKNQLSLIYKRFWLILLVVLFLAAFVTDGLSTAHAQQIATITPTNVVSVRDTTSINYLPELKNILPTGLKNSIAQTLVKRPVGKLPGDSLTIVGLRFEQSWGLATVVSSKVPDIALAQNATDYGLLQPGKTDTLLFVNIAGKWDIVFAETQEFLNLVKLIPLSELSQQARNALMNSAQISVEATDILFPWRYTETWTLTTGWHSDYYGNNALDFAPSGSSTRDVLSVTDAIVIGICGPDDKQVQIRTRGPAGDWYYLHLDKNQPYPKIGDAVSQGAVVGKIFSTSGEFSSSCGHGTGPHVHLTTPNQSFTMDGWTVNPDNVWAKPGYANKTVGSTFVSTNGSIGSIGGLVKDNGGDAKVKFTNGAIERYTIANSGGSYFFGNLPFGPATIYAEKNGAIGHVGVTIYDNKSVPAPDIILNQCGSLDIAQAFTCATPTPGPTATLAPPAQCPNDNRSGVYFYADKNYQGDCFFSTSSITNFGQTVVGDNRLSSVRIIGDWDVRLYEYTNYSGRYDQLGSNDSNLDIRSLGDQYSSAKIYSPPASNCPSDNREGVYMYSNTNYGGTCFYSTSDVMDFGATPLGNNALSSIRIIGTWEAKIYEDVNLSGRYDDLGSDDPNLDIRSLGRQYSSAHIWHKNPSPTKTPMPTPTLDPSGIVLLGSSVNNSGFETGNMSGWSQVSGSFDVNGSFVHSGKYAVNGTSATEATFYHDFSIDPYRNWIDAGYGSVDFGAWLDPGNSENGRLLIYFLDASMKELDNYNSGWITNEGESYTFVGGTHNIPPNSAYLRYQIYAKRSDGSYTDVNVDDTSLVLHFDVPSPPTSTPTPLSPLMISGNAGVGGALINYTGGSTMSNDYGYYYFIVPPGWSGTVTPSKTGFNFSPASNTYSGVVADQITENYTARLNIYTISGSLGATGTGATIIYTGGSTTADSTGKYSFTVLYGWSGTVTPSKSGVSFTPSSYIYNTVTRNQTNQNYTTNQSASFVSIGSQDGWILETAETSNKGGKLNKGAKTLLLGDNAAKKQYRAILSFNTSGIPDNAVITNITLKVKKQGITGGGNPVTAFKGFMVDIKKGTFGKAMLQTTDFQAKANNVYGPFKPSLTGGWYNINLTNAKTYINKLATNGGLTQIRLRFKLDDNNNATANILKLYSGNAPAASRPQLVITYYMP